MTTDHRNDPMIMPMFVYGTLLPGHYNHELVEDDYVHVDQGVVIAGQLFWAHAEGSYPVAKVDLPGRIVGAILWIDILSNGFYHASMMEKVAGAVQSFKVDASPGETRWFVRRYRETNITVRTRMGTYRFMSVARVPIQRVRGIFEYCSGKSS